MMKAKIFLAACLVLYAGILNAQELYGAFKIKTKPKNADVNLYDIDQYLCSTPSPVYPVLPDEYMELREGIPGRAIMLMISKKGYVPLKKEIFVPFLYTSQDEAMEHPSVFFFELERDHHRKHFYISWYYSCRWPRLRPHWHHDGPCHPWFPPGFNIVINPPHPPHPPGGGHHGGGHHPPPPPPGGGGHNPPGGGGHGGGGNPPPPPPPGGGNGGGGINPPPPPENPNPYLSKPPSGGNSGPSTPSFFSLTPKNEKEKPKNKEKPKTKEKSKDKDDDQEKVKKNKNK
jgi:hypothetical protein